MSQNATIREVTIFFPSGQTRIIPGDRVSSCGTMPPAGVKFVDEIVEGGKLRYIDLPYSILLEEPSAIQTVAALPPQLKRTPS